MDMLKKAQKKAMAAAKDIQNIIQAPPQQQQQTYQPQYGQSQGYGQNQYGVPSALQPSYQQPTHQYSQNQHQQYSTGPGQPQSQYGGYNPQYPQGQQQYPPQTQQWSPQQNTQSAHYGSQSPSQQSPYSTPPIPQAYQQPYTPTQYSASQQQQQQQQPNYGQPQQYGSSYQPQSSPSPQVQSPQPYQATHNPPSYQQHSPNPHTQSQQQQTSSPTIPQAYQTPLSPSLSQSQYNPGPPSAQAYGQTTSPPPQAQNYHSGTPTSQHPTTYPPQTYGQQNSSFAQNPSQGFPSQTVQSAVSSPPTQVQVQQSYFPPSNPPQGATPPPSQPGQQVLSSPPSQTQSPQTYPSQPYTSQATSSPPPPAIHSSLPQPQAQNQQSHSSTPSAIQTKTSPPPQPAHSTPPPPQTYSQPAQQLTAYGGQPTSTPPPQGAHSSPPPPQAYSQPVQQPTGYGGQPKSSPPPRTPHIAQPPPSQNQQNYSPVIATAPVTSPSPSQASSPPTAPPPPQTQAYQHPEQPIHQPQAQHGPPQKVPRKSVSQAHPPVQYIPTPPPPQEALRPSPSEENPQIQYTPTPPPHPYQSPPPPSQVQQPVYELQSPASQYPPLPTIPQGKPQPLSQPEVHLEDSGLIPVSSEDPPQNHFQTIAPSPLKIQKRQRPTKCIGFDPVLTDVVEFYELKQSVAKSHNLPAAQEGACLAICEYCFHTIIGPHSWFASCFDIRLKGEPPADQTYPQISFEKLIGCALAFPTIRQTVLNFTIPSRSIQPFIEYARIDAALTPCNTAEPRTGDYYGSRSIESLAVCDSCYQCYIRGTYFEGQFSLMSMPNPEDQWTCDIGYDGYIQRTLVNELSKPGPNFAIFLTETNKMLSNPPCAGEGKPIALSGPKGSTCFRSVKDNCGVFCSTCFHDCVVGLPGAEKFGYEIEIEDENQKASLACDLTLGISKYFMGLAVKAGNFDVWHEPILAKSLPLCPSIAGIDEVDLIGVDPVPVWYHFKGHPEIEICPRCYGMNICSLSAQELFVPITRPPRAERIRQCYLSPVKVFTYSFDPMDYDNTTAWRGSYIRNTITYCRDAGIDFTIAKQAAAHIASLPPACGSELRKFKKGSGRRFFGHQAQDPNDKNDATVMMCEECHLYSVKGTQLESFLSEDLTHLTWSNPEGHRCSTWSKQCKRRLRTACETGDFATYAQWHHKREEVYHALWKVIREMEPMNVELKNHAERIRAQTLLDIQMGGLRLQQQMNNQMNATLMRVGGGIAEAAASDTGMRYGNSTVGMNYLTSAGANAAQASHNALNQPVIDFTPQVDWRNVSLEQLEAEMRKKLATQDELRKQWAIMD